MPLGKAARKSLTKLRNISLCRQTSEDGKPMERAVFRDERWMDYHWIGLDRSFLDLVLSDPTVASTVDSTACVFFLNREKPDN